MQAPSFNSPALAVAVLALVAAVAGTAVAGDPVASTSKLTKKKVKKVADKRIAKLAPGLSVANANKLAGQPPSDFLASSKLREFDVTLNGGGSQVIATAGPLTFTATCTQNGTDSNGNANEDFLTILISTSQDGAVFDAFDSKLGQNAGDFLNTGTPASERVFAEISTNGSTPSTTGAPYFDANDVDGGALAPNGTRVFGRGDQFAVALNQFGGVCRGFGNFYVLG